MLSTTSECVALLSKEMSSFSYWCYIPDYLSQGVDLSGIEVSNVMTSLIYLCDEYKEYECQTASWFVICHVT